MNIKLKTFLWLLGLSIVVVGSVALMKQTKSDTIAVGILIPKTGLAAAIGEDNRRGIELAYQDLLLKYPQLAVSLVEEDTAYDPKVAVTAYNKVRSMNNAAVIITGGTKISGPLKDLAAKDRVVQMAIWSAAPSYSDTHDLNYRTTALSDDNVPVLADYLKSKNYTKLALLSSEDEFGVTYRQSFEKTVVGTSIQIVASEGYTPTANDFRTQLNKIKAAKPDAIFFSGTAPQLGIMFKQAREMGITAQFLGQGAAENAQMLAATQGAAEGLVYSYYFDPEIDQAKNFSKQYQAKYGIIPSQYAAEAYVGLMLVGESIQACDNKLNTSCWKNYLDTFRRNPTILGNASVNSRGDLKPEKVFLKTIRNGQFVKLD